MLPDYVLTTDQAAVLINLPDFKVIPAIYEGKKTTTKIWATRHITNEAVLISAGPIGSVAHWSILDVVAISQCNGEMTRTTTVSPNMLSTLPAALLYYLAGINKRLPESEPTEEGKAEHAAVVEHMIRCASLLDLRDQHLPKVFGAPFASLVAAWPPQSRHCNLPLRWSKKDADQIKRLHSPLTLPEKEQLQ